MRGSLFVQPDLMSGVKYKLDDDVARYVLVKLRGGEPVVETDDSGMMQLQTMTVITRARAMNESAPINGIASWLMVQRLNPGEKPDVELWPISERLKEIQRAATRGERLGKPKGLSSDLRGYIAAKQTERLAATVDEAIAAARDPAAVEKPLMPLSELKAIRAKLAGESPPEENPKTEKRRGRSKRSTRPA